MYVNVCSIALRTCRGQHFRSCLNAKRALVVPTKRLSTVPAPNDGPNTAEWRNIYKGMLTSRIRNLKIVSFVTSGMGLCVQPMLVLKAIETGSSLAATIGVCTITAFFTFITPILIHLVTKKYVTSLEYNEKNEEYVATIISFFLKPKQVRFKPFEVRLPMTPKLTVTFYAKDYPLFVDSQAFEDVVYYQRLLGYDKPYEFVNDANNVKRKAVVKPANKI